MPSCFNGTRLRISGIFISGIAGMKSSTATSASVTGCPPVITITSKVFSPVLGGLGSLFSVMSTFSVAAGAAVPGVAALSLELFG